MKKRTYLQFSFVSMFLICFFLTPVLSSHTGLPIALFIDAMLGLVVGIFLGKIGHRFIKD